MVAIDLEIGLPVIVAEPPLEMLKDAHSKDRIAAALGMGTQESPAVITKAVEPMEGFVDLDAGFVGVKHGLLH